MASIINTQESFPCSLPKIEHDVFLSFRGEDTRRSFTDHLYYSLVQKGINTFRDDENLHKGNEISQELLKAIEDSRFAIVILSKDYASSTWCLEELVKIMECKKVMGLTVFPVFYHVEPSEVRKQTGHFGKAFDLHRETFIGDLERMNKWMTALTETANLAGWHVTDRHESEVVQEITTKISNILNYTFLSANRDLVGMDSRMEKMEFYLDIKSDDICTIGIWGMGGIGKTSIAQEVFKKMYNKFEACSYIANVREKSRKNGLVYLQKLLYKNLLNSDANIMNVDMGITILSNRLRSKKVLIILDDVDELKQIEVLVKKDDNSNPWLGKGSRIIITSRDKHFLEAYGMNHLYEVEKLTDAEALQLLCQKAFKNNCPNEEYEKLSKKVLNYACGLPLALEVLGSFLYGRNVDEWLDALARLEKDPEEGIFSPLKISFDGLKDTEKKVFLDIACFFKGEDLHRVTKILESCGFYPRIGISVLIDKSLITIDRNKLWMHDLLQQMGWHIVRQESPEEPSRRSRLWIHDDIYDVLSENTGTNAVEGIFFCLPEREEIELTADSFSSMRNLRLLKIHNAILSGFIGSLSNKLRVLEWHECPLESITSSFQAKYLVELKMPSSRTEQLWNEKLSLERLLLVDLSNCQYLTKTPNFNKVPNLERLILEDCKNLSELHPSIGNLQHLVLLNLKGCESLESLPHSINLKSLRVFVLSGCSKLCHFPEIKDNMENLHELHLDGTAMQELPRSINYLTGLLLLNLKGCNNLLSFPTTLCNLTSLKILNLSSCSIEELPDNIGSLESLQELDVSGSDVRRVPSSIGLLKKLKLLSFRKCKLAEAAIPDDIGYLSSLLYLDLSENDFESIPESISQLSTLRLLSLDKCTKLLSLPKVLPLSIKNVYARDCPLLKTNLNGYTIWISDEGFSCIDCRMSEQGEDWPWHPYPISEGNTDVLFPKLIEDQIYDGVQLEICFPYSRIPDWCKHTSESSVITLQLSPDSSNSEWIGVALFVIFEIHEDEDFDACWEPEESYCQFFTDEGPSGNPIAINYLEYLTVGSFGLCCYKPQYWSNQSSKIGASISTSQSHLEVKYCGMHLISEDNVPKFVQDLSQTSHEHLEMELSFSRHCKPLLNAARKYEESSTDALQLSYDQSEPHSTSNQLPHKSEQLFTSLSGSSESSSCKIKEELKSLLSVLFQGENPRQCSYYFIFSHKVISPWFFHHCVGDFAVCYIPQDLLNDNQWVGLELYVIFNWYPPVRSNDLLSRIFVDLHTHCSNSVLGSLSLCFGIDSSWGSDQLLVFHIPRKVFQDQLNECRGISALFRSISPDVKAEACGARLVYEQDLEELVSKIIDCTQGRKDILDLLHMQAEIIVENPFVLGKKVMREVKTIEPNTVGEEVSSIDLYSSFQREILKSIHQLLTSSELAAEQVSTLLKKHSNHLIQKHGRRDFDPILLHNKSSVLKDHLHKNITKQDSVCTYHHVHVMVDTLLYENNLMALKKILHILLHHYKDCILATLSLKGNIISIKKHFDPDGPYNFCFPQKEIMQWFEHQSYSSKVITQLPINLYDDNNWRGLVVCVAFSVHEHPTTILSKTGSKRSSNVLCHLRTSEYCLNPVPMLSIAKDNKFIWCHLRGFIWLTYVPRALLTELNAQSYVEARIYNPSSGLMVEKSGIRLLYEQDIEEFKQMMLQCWTSFFDHLEHIYQFVETNVGG